MERARRRRGRPVRSPVLFFWGWVEGEREREICFFFVDEGRLRSFEGGRCPLSHKAILSSPFVLTCTTPSADLSSSFTHEEDGGVEGGEERGGGTTRLFSSFLLFFFLA